MLRPCGPHHTFVPFVMATVLLLTGAVLAGCLSASPVVSEKEEEWEPLVFSDSRGPSGNGTLIPLKDDLEHDANAILQECIVATDKEACVIEHLQSVLDAEGSIVAFDLLEKMSELDTAIERRNHPIAHVLGNHALYVYGTIDNTLANCSYKVFQGCLHGAMEEFFRYVEELDARTVGAVCPEGGTRFEQYACLHGLGHGLVLATHYDLGKSLDLCATLQTSHARNSCYGGAFMENVVAYQDSKRGGHGPHDHGHHSGEPLKFWVNEADPLVPCSIVKKEYERACWGMQTSLVLYLNGGSIQATARTCDGLDESVISTCYRSLGRDVSSRTNQDPGRGSVNCSHASTNETRADCVRGWIGTVVTDFADPWVALEFCPGFDEQDRPACYESAASTGRGMVSSKEMEEICDQVEGPYQPDCRRGGGL